MYRASDLKTGLLNLWGWRQNHDVSDYVIADSLTVSETGQYFQEVHPLLTLDNLKSIAPTFEDITYPDWAIATQYRIGDRVTHNEGTYRALTDNLGRSPETSTTDWERFDAFSLWLEEKTEGAIIQAIRTFWDTKMAEKTAKNVLESKALFDGAGRLEDLIANQDKVVGFEIVPIRAEGITVKIDKIGLQFTKAGTMTLYLMHSSRSVPVQEIELTRTREGGQEWFTPSTDIYLPYISEDNDAGGSWYLVYLQDELPVLSQAVNKSKDWSAKPCSSCNSTEASRWNIWSRYLEIHPFSVSNVEAPLAMWDIADNVYDYNTNYGINLKLTIECDVTDIILEQKSSFQNIIGLQVAVNMLREMAYNPEFKIGRTQQQLSMQTILYELDGDSQSVKKSGLVHRLNEAFKAISIDASNMSRVCLPCNNKGIRYRTA